MSQIELRTSRRLRLVVAVGSTEFQDLLQAFDNDAVQQVIANSGVTHIIFQVGRGTYRPKDAIRLDDGKDYWAQLDSKHPKSPRWGFVEFTVNYKDMLATADAVITHGGAGTLMDLIELAKPTLAVSNPTLHENHQVELCEALQGEGLCEFFDGTYLKGNPEQFAEILKNFLNKASSEEGPDGDKPTGARAFWQDAAKAIHQAITEDFGVDLFDDIDSY